jgi:hypothetical protein
MTAVERLKSDLAAVIVGPGGAIDAANRLCRACMELLHMDGAAISIVNDGVTQGTFGSSGESSRTLDDLQFTFGEGPSLDAVRQGQPVLAADLNDLSEQRWPGLLGALIEMGIRSIFVFPFGILGLSNGALTLFRKSAGSLSELTVSGARWAAELAVLPLRDLVSHIEDGEFPNVGDGNSPYLGSLERVEVYQATGMVMAQLDVDSVEALARVRAYAFALNLTASEVAWSIVERQLSFDHNTGDGVATLGPLE